MVDRAVGTFPENKLNGEFIAPISRHSSPLAADEAQDESLEDGYLALS